MDLPGFSLILTYLSHDALLLTSDDQCIFLIFDRYDMDLRRYLNRRGCLYGFSLRQAVWQLFSGAQLFWPNDEEKMVCFLWVSGEKETDWYLLSKDITDKKYQLEKYFENLTCLTLLRIYDS